MLKSVAGRFGAAARHASAGQKVYVVGVGMTKFEKPGSRKNFDYPEMCKEACERSLEDAGGTRFSPKLDFYQSLVQI